MRGQECCPSNYQTVTLSPNSDTFSTNTSNQCVVALAGSDTIAANTGNPIVLAGPGDDTIIAGANALVRGGDGRDTINVWAGPSTVYGGSGDDTINAANGDNLVVPGPGRDTVAMGTGNDTLALYDLCEVNGGPKNLDGGSGTNTLITPVPVAQLRSLGYTVSNFQNVIVQANSCKSECVTQPDCSGHGSCGEGPTAGSVKCVCDPAFQGAKCNVKKCASTDDTDLDGVPDCTDLCPYDKAKTAPGACDCGTADSDGDNDGTPDCLEHASQDPNNTNAGECGAVGLPGLKPAGTKCRDTACPTTPAGALATCNGAGVCGNRSECIPDTRTGVCRFFNWQGTSYWLCGGNDILGGLVNEARARNACAAKGLALARVNTPGEQHLLAAQIKTPLWLGANDLSANNAWRWSTPTSNDGDPFWSGGATGTPVGGRFSFWAPGAPGAQRCVTMRPGDGAWVDTNCSETHAYLCEYATPIAVPGTDGTGGSQVPGLPAQPQVKLNDVDCVPEALSKLPGTMAELTSDYEQARLGNFVGAAANRPFTGSCKQPDPKSSAIGFKPNAAGCKPINVKSFSGCVEDVDCAVFGSDFVCRSWQDDVACSAPDGVPIAAPGRACKGHSACMQLDCAQDEAPCDEITVCNPGNHFDAGLEPTSYLDAGEYNPAQAFGGTLPDAAPVGEYKDPVLHSGTNHEWCSMNPQHTVPKATQPMQNFKGQSGNDNTKLRFGFDPDLIFDVDPKPLALGESDPLIHVKALLGASVSMKDFLTVSFTQPILEASAGIRVSRCSVDTTIDTKFVVFGFDNIPVELLGIPSIDSNNNASPLRSGMLACTSALADFGVAADRAKKSFRDAQQLLQQYWAARDAGKTLSRTLCTDLGINTAKVPNFPGGNACPPNEGVETTINRFVDFYQKPGDSEITRLRGAASTLADVTRRLKNSVSLVNLHFADTHADESQTIVNVPFAIGPVPMVLQIDAFAQYGISGDFDLNLNFQSNLDSQPSPSQQLAHVKASVVPYASAGLSAFVGAGFDFGALTATLGLEGAITLAKIHTPIFVGAGLDVQVVADPRPIPADILPPVSVAAEAFQFNAPKSFKFSVAYDYGASVDVSNVLSGELNGRLRIKFFFFSRTWRKQVVKFDGWSKHFDLVHGGSYAETQTVPVGTDTNNKYAPVASGGVAAGLGEAQVPLMQLASLNLPAAVAPTTTVPFNASKVESMFYDNLCCIKQSETCFGYGARPECCPGLKCEISGTPPEDGGLNIAIGTCVKECSKINVECGTAADCCAIPGATGDGVPICGSAKKCTFCQRLDASCETEVDCCGANTFCNASKKCAVKIDVPVVK